MGAGQKAAILKKVTSVLLAILVVWLLNGMYAHHQTTSVLVQEVDHLKATNSALTKEADDLKATDGVLTKEINDLKAIDGNLTKQVDDLKTTNGNLTKQVNDLKTTNGALVKFMVKQLVKDSESSATTRFFGLKKFLDSNETTKAGDSFLCKGLSWHLKFRHTSELGDYLGVYLCHDISDFFGYTFRHWSANATFNLTLANYQNLNGNNQTEDWSYVFEKNKEYHCYGQPKFVRISDLKFGFFVFGLNFQVQIKSLELNLID